MVSVALCDCIVIASGAPCDCIVIGVSGPCDCIVMVSVALVIAL